jgi:hypothetical protein
VASINPTHPPPIANSAKRVVLSTLLMPLGVLSVKRVDTNHKKNKRLVSTVLLGFIPMPRNKVFVNLATLVSCPMPLKQKALIPVLLVRVVSIPMQQRRRNVHSAKRVSNKGLPMRYLV